MVKRFVGGVAVAVALAVLVIRPLFLISCEGWFAWDPFCWWIGG